MKNFFFFAFLLTSIIFTGCSSKKATPSSTTKVQTTQNTTTQTKEQDEDEFEDDEFLEEFEQEMKVEKRSDPFEGYNRAMTSFNDGLMEYVVTPVANGYDKVTSKDVQKSVKNFFHNILYPIRLVNNLLQGKIKNSGEETGRFVINTTIGVFGLFDPAKKYFDLEPHNEDFGQTLGHWGVGSGPHIVLPFFGPSNLRDMVSMYPDSLANPVDYKKDRSYNLAKNFEQSLLLKGLDKVNATALSDGMYQKLKKDAVDLYPFLRDIYEQRREQLIKE